MQKSSKPKSFASCRGLNQQQQSQHLVGGVWRPQLNRAEVPPPGKTAQENKHSTEFTSSASDKSFFLFRRHEHVWNSPSAQLVVQLGRQSIKAAVLSLMLNSFHIIPYHCLIVCLASVPAGKRVWEIKSEGWNTLTWNERGGTSEPDCVSGCVLTPAKGSDTSVHELKGSIDDAIDLLAFATPPPTHPAGELPSPPSPDAGGARNCWHFVHTCPAGEPEPMRRTALCLSGTAGWWVSGERRDETR